MHINKLFALIAWMLGLVMLLVINLWLPAALICFIYGYHHLFRE